MAEENINCPEDFYTQALKILNKSGLPFLVGGSYAVMDYTGIKRETNDFDIFCKPGDYLQILDLFKHAEFKTEISDPRWLAKAFFNKSVVDLIFGTAQGVVPIDDTWFETPYPAEILGQKVRLVPPEEIIWSKAYRQDRYRYDGPDINHMFLKKGDSLDWKRLLTRMEAHWEILFAHILNFRFVYPSEKHIVPGWLMAELIRRLTYQLSSPIPKEKITRGLLLAIDPYKIDVEEWGYKSIT